MGDLGWWEVKLICIVLQLDLNQAINMVSYFDSSLEPVSVRGKTVYIWYSNRHELVNNKQGSWWCSGKHLSGNHWGRRSWWCQHRCHSLGKWFFSFFKSITICISYCLGNPHLEEFSTWPVGILGTLLVVVCSTLFFLDGSLSCLKLSFNCSAPWIISQIFC